MVEVKNGLSSSAKKILGKEAVAIAISIAILVSAGFFWVIQIRGVIELLNLAYG